MPILTLGIALILQNGGLYAFGSAPVSIATPLSSSAWELGPLVGDSVSVFVNQGQTVAAAIALAAVLTFVALMGRSRLGKSLRAAADNACGWQSRILLGRRVAVGRIVALAMRWPAPLPTTRRFYGATSNP